MSDQKVILLAFVIKSDDVVTLDDYGLMHTLHDVLPDEWFEANDGDDWYVDKIVCDPSWPIPANVVIDPADTHYEVST